MSWLSELLKGKPALKTTILPKQPIVPTPPAPPPPVPVAQPEAPKVEVKPMPRKINTAGIELLKSYEGLELEAYPDPASALGQACTARNLRMRAYRQVQGWEMLRGDPWTIGYGHTGPEVKAGMKLQDEAAAIALKMKDLERFENFVEANAGVPLTDNQFAALVSFAYNCGTVNLKNSTLLKKLKLKDYAGAAEEFSKWNKAQGKVLPGLTKRRAAERSLFLS